ncbi:hypothetical protein [Nonomuraea sp. NPDC049684]|uniref:hypothetical protein n=1 Tax=Nonomuraea sp. NPDC049684 TaxID=3364356 RepID=UPI00378DB0B9
MQRVQLGAGPLVIAAVVAALVTILIITGHGSEAPLVVGAVSMVLGPYAGRNKAAEDGRAATRAE